jgi:hypothetical protein
VTDCAHLVWLDCANAFIRGWGHPNMENNYAAREKRRIRYNAAILTFLSVATATIVGFIS